ncbi:binding-protein-dependent transport system inner membrane protein [Microcella alkaliphila]|uniref:Binding-protein-dependent transport system inner membrane protein n=2 Tax=Microcella alkaliphila TaxID=279828 RepID=A0A0U5B571_9MICO|nr:binding-protein-dependent transport system inner membrane protein [Microcella alkaliphila]
MLVSAIFVYAFIGVTIYISFSNWKIGTNADLSLREPLGATYVEMLQEFRAQSSLRNIIVFTVLFLAIAILAGLVAALLIHHVAIGRGFFRTVFLLPYALSFIVTGVVWRWIFAPATGINEILRAIGIADPPGWTTDTTIIGALNDPSGTDFLKVQLGVPVALIPIIVAAAWQLLGFAMAMYLAGLGSIPEEHLEAASVDGANAWQRIRHIVLPQLWPATVTCLVLLLHVALKIFDLVVAMSGSGPGFVTDVPGIYIYNYLTSRYDKASAMSIVLLVMTLAVIVPYLVRGYRHERKA